jgi:hypothetical protein
LDLKLKDEKGDLGTCANNGEWHLLGKVLTNLTKVKLKAGAKLCQAQEKLGLDN